MASSPLPTPAVASPDPVTAAAAPLAGGLDAVPGHPDNPRTRAVIRETGEGILWFLAICRRCDPDFAQPFRVESERDDWAAGHVTGTGHVVHLSVDGLGELPGLHLSGVISRDQAGTYRFVCPAPVCSVSNGPYSSAQLAIVSWRNHPVAVKR